MLLVTASIGRVRFPPPAPPPRVFGNFVELRGGALFLDGKPFHFVGTNIYWLMTKAAQRNYELVEQVLDECVKMGLRVVRTWAFWLGPQNSLHPEGSDTHCSAAGCPIGDRVRFLRLLQQEPAPRRRPARTAERRLGRYGGGRGGRRQQREVSR